MRNAVRFSAGNRWGIRPLPSLTPSPAPTPRPNSGRRSGMDQALAGRPGPCYLAVGSKSRPQPLRRWDAMNGATSAWYHGGDLEYGEPKGTYLYVTDRRQFAEAHAGEHPNGRVYR